MRSMDYFYNDCDHVGCWDTVSITPYTTVIRCVECGEERTVHDH